MGEQALSGPRCCGNDGSSSHRGRVAFSRGKPPWNGCRSSHFPFPFRFLPMPLGPCAKPFTERTPREKPQRTWMGSDHSSRHRLQHALARTQKEKREKCNSTICYSRTLALTRTDRDRQWDGKWQGTAIYVPCLARPFVGRKFGWGQAVRHPLSILYVNLLDDFYAAPCRTSRWYLITFNRIVLLKFVS